MTSTTPYNVIPILNRLANRSDLPADVVASLELAASVVAFSEAEIYKKGFTDGRLEEKRRFAGLFIKGLKK